MTTTPIQIAVPASVGAGAGVDVSGLKGETRTLIFTPPATLSLIQPEVSDDNVNWAPLPFSLYSKDTRTFDGNFKWIRANRQQGSGGTFALFIAGDAEAGATEEVATCLKTSADSGAGLPYGPVAFYRANRARTIRDAWFIPNSQFTPAGGDTKQLYVQAYDSSGALISGAAAVASLNVPNGAQNAFTPIQLPLGAVQQLNDGDTLAAGAAVVGGGVVVPAGVFIVRFNS